MIFMTSREFVYWLQGFFEVSGSKRLSEKQTAMIKNDLNLVFKHEIDPSYGLDSHHAQNTHDGANKPNSGILFRC